MIIRSLCYFPSVKGGRSESAERAIRSLLNSFRTRLLTISLAAFTMRSLPLVLPFAFQQYLPILLGESEPSSERWQTLATVLSLIVVVVTLHALAAFYFLSAAGRTGHQLVASLRELAFAQLMRLPVGYVETRGAGCILLSFIGDTDALRNWFSKTGPKFVADGATIESIQVLLRDRVHRKARDIRIGTKHSDCVLPSEYVRTAQSLWIPKSLHRVIAHLQRLHAPLQDGAEQKYKDGGESIQLTEFRLSSRRPSRNRLRNDRGLRVLKTGKLVSDPGEYAILVPQAEERVYWNALLDPRHKYSICRLHRQELCDSENGCYPVLFQYHRC